MNAAFIAVPGCAPVLGRQGIGSASLALRASLTACGPERGVPDIAEPIRSPRRRVAAGRRRSSSCFPSLAASLVGLLVVILVGPRRGARRASVARHVTRHELLRRLRRRLDQPGDRLASGDDPERDDDEERRKGDHRRSGEPGARRWPPRRAGGRGPLRAVPQARSRLATPPARHQRRCAAGPRSGPGGRRGAPSRLTPRGKRADTRRAKPGLARERPVCGAARRPPSAAVT